MPQITIEGARITYEERGKGDPVIFLHGWNSSRKEWLLNLKGLAPRFRAIALDLPGFGDSEEIPGFAYTLDGITTFLEAFRRGLRLHPFHLVAHSMGGCIAIAHTARYPENVKRLVLVSTPTRSSSIGLRANLPGVSAFISMTYHFRSDGVLKWMFYHSLYEPEYQDLDFVRANVKTISRTTRRALVQSARLLRRMNLADDLRGIAQPTMIVFGDRDKTVNTGEVARQRELLPHPYVAIITGSGHSPNYERPEVFNQLVFDFLQEQGF